MKSETSMSTSQGSAFLTATILFFAGNVFAQGVNSESDESLEEIVVIGSSVAINEQQAESEPTPIEMISGNELSMTGLGSVAEFLLTKPAFTGSSPDSDGLGVGRQTLNLRGLGPQYTLSLINGRRFSVNGAANVGVIPFSAVERIEVLTAGASSIYGSDAVAGVANMVLKRSADGAGVSLRTGSGAGDLDETEITGYFGSNGPNGGYIVTLNHYEREGLVGGDLPTGTNNLSLFGSFDLRSSFTNPARIILGDDSEVILNTDTVGPGQSSLDPNDYRAYDENRDAHDRFSGGIYAISPTRRTTALFSGSVDLGDRTVLTGDLLFNHTKDTNNVGAAVTSIAVPAGHPHNPFGEDVTANFRFLEFGDGPFNLGLGQVTEYELDTVSAALSLEHELTDDLTGSITANFFREDQRQNILNAYSLSGLQAAMARGDETAFNPFCNRCNSAEQQAGVLVGTGVDRVSDLAELEARVSGELMELSGGPLQLAAGVSFRDETLDVDPQRNFETGDVIDVGTVVRQTLGRDVLGLFAEVRVPLLDNLDVQAALRYEDYSDFGSTVNPLVAVRWEALPDNLTFRASFNSSFRAPFLQDLTSERNVSSAILVDPMTGLPTNALSITGGNPDLESEDADTFSIGAIVTPEALEGFVFKLDYFEVEQTNIVISPSPQAVLAGIAPGTVERGPGAGGGTGDEELAVIALLANGGKRTVSGIDFQVGWSHESQNGVGVNLELSGTHLTKYDNDELDGSGASDLLGSYSSFFGGIPETKLTLFGAVEYNAFTGTAKWRRIDGYADDELSGLFGSTPFKVPSVDYFDIALSVDLGSEGLDWLPGGSVTIGIDNVGDELPPFVDSAVLFRGAPWDRGSHDLRGRFTYLKLGVEF